MEKEIKINDLNTFLKNIKYSLSLISYSTNTIDIIFKDEKDKWLYSIAINPSWRITLNNRMIINSRNYPYHENYTEEESEKESNDFYEWCSKTDFMKNEKVVGINVLETYDLVIKWENGAILNEFVNEVEDADYNIYDWINNKVYRIMYGKIIQDDIKQYKK